MADDDEGSGFIVSIYVWANDKDDARAEIERLAPQFVDEIESIEKVDY